MPSCPTAFYVGRTEYRRCVALRDRWGFGPNVRAGLCGDCDGTRPNARVEEFVCALLLANRHARTGRTADALAARIVEVAGRERLAERLVQSVRTGGLTAVEAERIARENGLDPDDTARTPGGGGSGPR